MNQDLRNAADGVPPPSQSGDSPKRRSLLPQLGTPKPTARSITLSDTPMDRTDSNQQSMNTAEPSKAATSIPLARGTSVSGSRLERLRPRSTYQLRSVAADKKVETGSSATSQSMRPPSLLSKPSSASLSGLGRTQSLRRPAVTTQPGPPATTTHARTQSINTVPLARSNTTRPRTNTERPKSMHIPTTLGSQINNSSVQPEPAATRTSTRLAGLSRSVSVKTRPEIHSSTARPRPAARPEEPALPLEKSREPTTEEPRKIARPAFSTLQQHFTPRKAGKAPTATFLHPAPVTTSNSLPPELISLQMDLLQLHLLHERAEDVSNKWEMSAQHKLQLKFDEVASMHQVMLEHERSGQEQKNIQALLAWTSDGPSGSLVEHIQALSGPLHELPSMVVKDGRLQRHATIFEKWISWVEEIRAARQSRTEAGLGSIEGLGDAWYAENAALSRKLTSFARDLDGISQPAAGSSIAAIVCSCRDLLDGLLEELRIMQAIEADVVLNEKDWVETRLQGIAADIGSFMVDEAPAWRV